MVLPMYAPRKSTDGRKTSCTAFWPVGPGCRPHDAGAVMKQHSGIPAGPLDRRAKLVTSTVPGQTSRVDPAKAARVTVVGGGLAGVSAALVLAERGVRVVLHEASPVLGGRVSSWSDQLNAQAGGESFQMERGFHAFFRQYYNVRALLRRIDPALRFLRPCHDYPLFGPDGAVESFADLPRTPPLNLLALVKRTPTLGLRDLLGIDGDFAAEMLAFDDTTYDRFDDMTAAAYLDAVKFPEAARRMLFEVFAHSFFNPQDEMSAAEMLMMFHLYFCGSSEGILFDILDQPFDDAIWKPLHRLMTANGVDVRLNSQLDNIPEPGASEGLVVAVNVEGLRAIVERNDWMRAYHPWSDDVALLQKAPAFAVWRIWFDTDVNPDRAPFAGTAGLGIIDNISCVHRYQADAQRWALRTGGSVIELHGYALPTAHAHRSNDDRLMVNEPAIKADLLRALHEVYPETQGAHIVDERFLVRSDCPSFEPGSWTRRPSVATGHPGLKLAGDLVRLPFPTALMERAVTSGFMAANELLGSWGVIPEPVWSIPDRGLLAGLQAWQRSRKGGR
jgi:carotenoid phi-ring synthase / carotenoid chi-ring synthase